MFYKEVLIIVGDIKKENEELERKAEKAKADAEKLKQSQKSQRLMRNKRRP